MVRAPRLKLALPLLCAALLAPGCQIVPRQQLDECRRLSQTLRSENAQLKDQMLVLKGQNRDLAERAVDDSRRLAQLEEANNRLETSVQAYQDERTKLESAFKELRASLPGSPQPLSLKLTDADHPAPGSEIAPGAETASDSRPALDPDPEETSGPKEKTSRPPRIRVRRPESRSDTMTRSHDAWIPARPKGSSRPASPGTDP
jgi:hypothetical protein